MRCRNSAGRQSWPFLCLHAVYKCSWVLQGCIKPSSRTFVYPEDAVRKQQPALTGQTEGPSVRESALVLCCHIRRTLAANYIYNYVYATLKCHILHQIIESHHVSLWYTVLGYSINSRKTLAVHPVAFLWGFHALKCSSDSPLCQWVTTGVTCLPHGYVQSGGPHR